jgi:hypothetical protein
LIDPTGHFSDDQLQEMLGFGDDKNAYDAFMESLDEFWRDTLYRADWLDEVVIGDNVYMFVKGQAKRRGPAYRNTDISPWQSRMTLAFWDVKNSRGVHFGDVLFESGYTFSSESGGSIGVTTFRSQPYRFHIQYGGYGGSQGPERWVSPNYNSFNPEAEEYIWFPEREQAMWRDIYWQTAQVAVVAAGVWIGIAEKNAVAPAASSILAKGMDRLGKFVGATDFGEDTLSVTPITPIPATRPVPYLRYGSPVWEVVDWCLLCQVSHW